eukprot:296237_1
MATRSICMFALWMTCQARTGKYILVKKALDTANASLYCQNTYGTYLASIHSPSENEEASSICKMTAACVVSNSCKEWMIACHIGLNDKASERHNSTDGWVWEDRSNYDYQNWRETEPNEGNDLALNEDCVVIFPTEHPVFEWRTHWADMRCLSVPLYFLCNSPTNNPSRNPTNDPSINPSRNPTNNPFNPTNNPYGTTVSPIHIESPSSTPTNTPSDSPTHSPTLDASFDPTSNPTTVPSSHPFDSPMLTVPAAQHPLSCDNNLQGNSDSNIMIFDVEIPYDGTIIFNASLSTMAVVDIKAYTTHDIGSAIASRFSTGHENNKVLTVNEVSSGHYIFIVSCNTSTDATFDIQISCEVISRDRNDGDIWIRLSHMSLMEQIIVICATCVTICVLLLCVICIRVLPARKLRKYVNAENARKKENNCNFEQSVAYTYDGGGEWQSIGNKNGHKNTCTSELTEMNVDETMQNNIMLDEVDGSDNDADEQEDMNIVADIQILEVTGDFVTRGEW